MTAPDDLAHWGCRVLDSISAPQPGVEREELHEVLAKFREAVRAWQRAELAAAEPEPAEQEQPAEEVRSWRWDGGRDSAAPITKWIRANGGLATYVAAGYPSTEECIVVTTATQGIVNMEPGDTAIRYEGGGVNVARVRTEEPAAEEQPAPAPRPWDGWLPVLEPGDRVGFKDQHGRLHSGVLAAAQPFPGEIGGGTQLILDDIEHHDPEPVDPVDEIAAGLHRVMGGFLAALLGPEAGAKALQEFGPWDFEQALRATPLPEPLAPTPLAEAWQRVDRAHQAVAAATRGGDGEAVADAQRELQAATLDLQRIQQDAAKDTSTDAEDEGDTPTEPAPEPHVADKRLIHEAYVALNGLRGVSFEHSLALRQAIDRLAAYSQQRDVREVAIEQGPLIFNVSAEALDQIKRVRPPRTYPQT